MKRTLSLVVVVISSVLWAQKAQQPRKPISQLTVRDLWKEGGITGRVPEQVKWSPDGTKVSYVVRDASGDKSEMWYIDANTGKPAVLITAEHVAALEPPTNGRSERQQERKHNYFGGYHWAPDSKHLLFDAKGQFWYYRLDNNTAIQLTSSSAPQQDPKFSPNGQYLAFIRKHQLHVHQLVGARDVQLTTARATAPKLDLNEVDVKKIDENILNGEVDWVYSEELDVKSNFFWSPDNKNIVFLQMDETRVPTYPIEDFIPKHPTVDEEKYPKAGDPNPEVRLGVVSRDGGGAKWVHLGISDAEMKELYVPRFGWVNDHVVWAQTLNRHQDEVKLYFADLRTGRARIVLSQKIEPYLYVNDFFRVLRSGDRFLWGDWRDGHSHLYMYSFDKADPVAQEAKLVNQITKGDFEVNAVDGVDEQRGIIYYESTEQGSEPDQFSAWRDRNIVARKFDGTRVWIQSGANNAASFASDAQHYVLTHNAIDTPPEMSFCTAGQDKNDCAEPFFRSRPFGYDVAEWKFLKLKADDGTPLEGMLLLPPNAPEGKKIPLLLNPYGGPDGGQQVTDSWKSSNGAFDQILANDGIAILLVDNRGTADRGAKFESVIYKNFGPIELKDQLTALDQVLQQYPQLDSSRIGWWGWSFGGYMTLYSMTHSDRITAGVSVAPVSNWELYDSIYTERYMRTPKENEEGYKNGSPVFAADGLHGDLIEVHGTSDDNVHMQNTIDMIQSFITANKQYSLLLFPRKTHGISGEDARTLLFERIRSFFDKELSGKQPPAAKPQTPTAQQ